MDVYWWQQWHHLVNVYETSSAIAEGLCDALVSRNPATTKHFHLKMIVIDKLP